MSQRLHPYGNVQLSPWPFAMSWGVAAMLMGWVGCFTSQSSDCLVIGMLLCGLAGFGWTQEIIRESMLGGLYSDLMQSSLRMGFFWFLFSEVMLFASCFWAFFHSSLAPGVWVGCEFPPAGVKPFCPIGLPLVATVVLLSSGVSVTWAHGAHRAGDKDGLEQGLGLTVLLGLTFTSIQAFEYKSCFYTIADSVYGSSFFLLTGLHGLHVVVGTLGLLSSLVRARLGHYTPDRPSVGFLASIWYWHFVDVVWLGVYSFVYVWGGYGNVYWLYL